MHQAVRYLRALSGGQRQPVSIAQARDRGIRACGGLRAVFTLDMLRDICRIEAGIGTCSMNHDHMTVEGMSATPSA